MTEDHAAENSSTFTRFLQQSPEDSILHRALTIPRRHSERLRLSDQTGNEREAKYRFLSDEPIGEGGTSVVFRVHDTEMNVTRALKILLVDITADSEAKRRWRREHRVLLELEKVDAPGVPTIFEVGIVDGMPAIIMQYVNGVTLNDFIERHSWKVPPSSTGIAAHRLDLVVGIITRIADTLGHIQREFAGTEIEGFAHGDLKPSNILLETSDSRSMHVPEVVRTWLLDFGEASVRGRPEATGVTPAYSSPEQMQNWISQRESGATAASDQYQLGAVLQELLDPLEPFVPRNVRFVTRWGYRVRTRHLRAVAERMTARRPEDRYHCFTNVSAELRRVATAPRRILSRITAVMVATVIGMTTLIAAMPFFGSRGDLHPLVPELAETAVTNEWSRWQSEALRDAPVGELRRQVRAQYDHWRVAYGIATANVIRDQLERRIALLERREYLLRIIDARREADSDDTFDTVYVSVEVDDKWIGPIRGAVTSDGSITFPESELGFSWTPSQSIDLLITTEGEMDRSGRQAWQKAEQQHAKLRREYEEQLREYERVRDSGATDVPSFPRPTGPGPVPGPGTGLDPWIPIMRAPVLARGAVALAVATRCTDSDGERLIGSFKWGAIEFEIEIRPTR